MDILEILEIAANYILCDVASYGYKVRICIDDTNGISETNASSEFSKTGNEIA